MLTGYSCRKIITIDHTLVDEALTDFTHTVVLTAANFPFYAARPDGYDIRFTSADGDTLLFFERVSHDAVAQTAEYHVLVPSVSADANTIVYLYYGKADATDGANGHATWDAGHVMVQHMGDATTSTITDSTANGHNGTKRAANAPIEAVGKVGKAQTFDGADDRVNIGEGSDYFSSDAPMPVFTAGAWIKTPGLASGQLMNGILSLTYGLILRLELDGNFGTSIDNGTKIVPYHTDGLNLADDVWHHVVLTYDGTKRYMYVDGVLIVNPNTTWPGYTRWPTGACMIGIDTNNNTNRYFNGLIDEVRISNIARSEAWIKAEYNSGNGTLATMTQDWTVGSSEKRRSAGGNAPTPDGDIGSYFDRRQVAGNYRGMPLGMSVGGSLSFTGALARSISLTHMGGGLTPTGAVAKSISKYLLGSLTPTGSLATAAIFPVSVGGELDLTGDLTGGNPDWIEIHPWMNWKGEWAVATEYALYDVVLYQDGLSIHAFVSKSSHNTGNLPTDAAHWDRLVQEKWRL